MLDILFVLFVQIDFELTISNNDISKNNFLIF